MSQTLPTNVSVLLESIRAAVRAYAEGKITKKEMPAGLRTKDQAIRYAPSFVSGDDPGALGSYPYTAQSLAKFLGMLAGNGEPQAKFKAALDALELIEEGLLTESQIANIGTKFLFELTSGLMQKRDRDRKEWKRLEEGAQRRREQAERDRAAAVKAKEEAEKKRKREEAERAEAEARRKDQTSPKPSTHWEAAKSADILNGTDYGRFKFTLFDHDGTAIYSTSTRKIGNAVKDVCNSLKKSNLKAKK